MRALTTFETTAIVTVTVSSRDSWSHTGKISSSSFSVHSLCPSHFSLPCSGLNHHGRREGASGGGRQSRSKPRRRQARSTAAAKPTKTNSTGAPRPPPAPGRARPIQVVGRSARAAHVRADGQPKERLENRGSVSCVWHVPNIRSCEL